MQLMLCPRAAEKQKVTPTMSGTVQNTENPYMPLTLHCSCLFPKYVAAYQPLSPACHPLTVGLIFHQHPAGYDYFIPF